MVNNGATSFDSSTDSVARTPASLPAEPGNYEDFQYGFEMFDFDDYTPSAAPATTSSSFYNDNHYGHAQSPMINPDTPQSTSQLFDPRSPLPPPPPPPPLPPPPATTTSFASQPQASAPTQFHLNPPSMPPPPLSGMFNAAEAGNLSNFLKSLDTDPTYLLNPTIPSGMPSPPPPLLPRADGTSGFEGFDFDFNFSAMSRGVVVVKEEEREGELYSHHHHHGRGSVSGQSYPLEHEQDDEDAASQSTPTLRTRGSGTRTAREQGGKKLRTSYSGGNEDPKVHGEEEDAMAMSVDGGGPVSASTSRRRLPKSSSSGGGGGGVAPRSTVRRPLSSSSATSVTPRGRTGSTATRPSLTAAAAVDPPPAQKQSASPVESAATVATTQDAATATHQDADDVDELVSEEEEEEEGGDDRENSQPLVGNGVGVGVGGVDRKAPLTESQKRSNHILSEQKRRNAIRGGFKDLVELIQNGETASGIVVAPDPAEVAVAEEEEGGAGGGRKKKSKGTGRGRGRKGEVGSGASKSAVLEKAAAYIQWLERGNSGLEGEVKRVEARLAAVKLNSQRL